MLKVKAIHRLLVLQTILVLTLSSATLAQNKSKDKKVTPTYAPVLWRNPTDIKSRNLILGSGGAEMQPDVSDLTFLKVETGGYSPKFRVRDGQGRKWVAKLGKEAQSETAAVRLLWAVGYPTEIVYLVPCVHIKGAPKPAKKVARCEGQGFANVRFEARPDNIERGGEWKWKRNPFLGTRELQGLIVMMGLLNNWDIKDSNNVVLIAPPTSQTRGESIYTISDLGATFGKIGGLPLLWRITRSRNNPKDFAKSGFIDKVKGDRVAFRYGGKNRGLFKKITVEQAKWIGDVLSRLSNQQIGDAFRAANYSPSDVSIMTQAVRNRINQLVRLPEPGVASLGRRDGNRKDE